MKHRHVLLFLAASLTLSACDQMKSDNGSENSSMTTPAVSGEVLATVNGSPITQDVLEIYATQRQAKGGNAETNSQDAILEELISLELMRQDSIKKGLNTQAMVVATLDQQVRTALAGAAIKDYMESNPISDEDAKAAYDEQMGSADKEYNARHILVDDEETAIEVIKLLDSGSDFSELAKEKSTGPSGPKGGNLGWFGAGQMVKPFSEATATLEKGAYTKTAVETQFGWHVIILDDVRDSTPPPFDDVKERIKLLLANQQLQKYVEAMKASASININ